MHSCSDLGALRYGLAIVFAVALGQCQETILAGQRLEIVDVIPKLPHSSGTLFPVLAAGWGTNKAPGLGVGIPQRITSELVAQRFDAPNFHVTDRAVDVILALLVPRKVELLLKTLRADCMTALIDNWSAFHRVKPLIGIKNTKPGLHEVHLAILRRTGR